MSDFYSIWRQQRGMAEHDQLPLCPIAQEFQKHLAEIIFEPLRTCLGDRVKIAQAKYLLQEEWHSWKKSIPTHHTRGSENCHRCVDSVYDESYDRLHLLDLRARPAIDLLPPDEPPAREVIIAPPPPVKVNVAGTVLGFEEEIPDENHH